MANLTKSPKPSQICHWDKLPKEMVDRICHFAYANKSSADFLTRDEWADGEVARNIADASATGRVFIHKVDDFMVSGLL